jgi:hypothetical protein
LTTGREVVDFFPKGHHPMKNHQCLWLIDLFIAQGIEELNR